MNLEQARTNMVEQQIRPWEVLDQDVLDLLYTVPREEFVPVSCRNLAFTDMEIPIGEGEKMWAPKMEARMLQELAPRRSDRVLEIGTGSGYLTALLAHRSAHVTSVEIKPVLAAFGKANIARHGVDNVTLEIGNGARGYAKAGPYDIVVLTGSVPVLPIALLESLAPGGRAFAVIGEAPLMAASIVSRTTRGAPLSFRRTALFETMIAPLANCEQPSRFAF
jgi:protein-L-isoaspartate(D-aspartate) O-methyltransferase